MELIKQEFIFSECEHQGDLDSYETDITSSGGTILSSFVDEESEEGYVTFTIKNISDFLNKFEQTDAHNFCLNL